MLDVRGLSVVFTDRGEPFTAVDNFSLRMDRGEIGGDKSSQQKDIDKAKKLNAEYK